MELESSVNDPAAIEQDIRQEMGTIVDDARALAASIKDDASRADAVAVGSSIQSKINRIKEKRENIVPPLRKAYERVRDFFDDALRPLEAAKRALAQSVSSYDVDQERLRRIEQERIEAENRRKREEYERQKAAWEITQAHERAMIEHEVWEKGVAGARFRQMREKKIREEEDSRIRHAQAAQEQGNVHKIERILEKTTPIAPMASEMPQERSEPSRAISAPLPPAAPPPPPVLAPAIVARRPDTESLSRDIWQWNGDDLFALAQAVAERRAPVEYLAFNGAIIGKDVRKLKDEFKCSGIRTWKERSTTFKAAKDE